MALALTAAAALLLCALLTLALRDVFRQTARGDELWTAFDDLQVARLGSGVDRLR